jgi:hypothetical protein
MIPWTPADLCGGAGMTARRDEVQVAARAVQDGAARAGTCGINVGGPIGGRAAAATAREAAPAHGLRDRCIAAMAAGSGAARTVAVCFQSSRSTSRSTASAT